MHCALCPAKGRERRREGGEEEGAGGRRRGGEICPGVREAVVEGGGGGELADSSHYRAERDTSVERGSRSTEHRRRHRDPRLGRAPNREEGRGRLLEAMAEPSPEGELDRHRALSRRGRARNLLANLEADRSQQLAGEAEGTEACPEVGSNGLKRHPEEEVRTWQVVQRSARYCV